jgi:hypothetical protein
VSPCTQGRKSEPGGRIPAKQNKKPKPLRQTPK